MKKQGKTQDRYFDIASADDMEQFGAALAKCLVAPAVVFLHGDLGAGKTTLVRGILQAKGWRAGVKSPTYTLVESYIIDDVHYHHFDLYRLADPEELEFLGVRDYFTDNAINFIEWPDRGEGIVPVADMDIVIDYSEQARRVKLVGLLPDWLDNIQSGTFFTKP